jgi:hypothetical protein
MIEHLIEDNLKQKMQRDLRKQLTKKIEEATSW